MITFLLKKKPVNIFIVIVKFQDNEPDSPECEAYMYAGQHGIQRFLILLALICVPWMLFAKPLVLKKEAASKPNVHFDIVETMILQGITIFLKR